MNLSIDSLLAEESTLYRESGLLMEVEAVYQKSYLDCLSINSRSDDGTFMSFVVSVANVIGAVGSLVT